MKLDVAVIKNIGIVNICSHNPNINLDKLYIKIVKKFTKRENLFFNIYKIDGINCSDFDNYINELESLFLEKAKIVDFEISASKRKLFGNTIYHKIGCLPYNDSLFEVLPKIFKCFLETSFFFSDIEWEEFKVLHGEDKIVDFNKILSTKIASFTFCYYDSGDFSIHFLADEHEKSEIENEIFKLYEEFVYEIK